MVYSQWESRTFFYILISQYIKARVLYRTIKWKTLTFPQSLLSIRSRTKLSWTMQAMLFTVCNFFRWSEPHFKGPCCVKPTTQSHSAWGENGWGFSGDEQSNFEQFIINNWTTPKVRTTENENAWLYIYITNIIFSLFLISYNMTPISIVKFHFYLNLDILILILLLLDSSKMAPLTSTLVRTSVMLVLIYLVCFSTCEPTCLLHVSAVFKLYE